MSELTIPLTPLIVQVAADWCQPCKRMRPLAETAANDLDVPFMHALIEDHPEVEETYGVSAVPTFLVFNHGKLQGSFTGSMSVEKLSEKFEALIDG